MNHNPTHMIPTALVLATAVRKLQIAVLDADQANLRFDLVAARIRREVGMPLTLAGLVTGIRTGLYRVA